MKPTFNAYIDGFNLYKGSLERRPESKWLDIVSLCKSLEPDATLDTVYYFTAPVKSRFVGDRASDRQATYLRVLEHSGVNLASYLLRDVYRDYIDLALIITGDSDLTVPVLFTKAEGVTAHVVVPGDGQNSASLKSAASSLTCLDVELLRSNQFPDSYLTPAGGNIQKPSSWVKTPLRK